VRCFFLHPPVGLRCAVNINIAAGLTNTRLYPPVHALCTFRTNGQLGKLLYSEKLRIFVIFPSTSAKMQ
jgi:hypothetical protein